MEKDMSSFQEDLGIICREDDKIIINSNWAHF
jgi:hypothetical protein